MPERSSSADFAVPQALRNTSIVARRRRARHLIEPGGLAVKAGIVELTGNDREMIYGALIWIADKFRTLP